jgi:hypothetical protein
VAGLCFFFAGVGNSDCSDVFFFFFFSFFSLFSFLGVGSLSFVLISCTHSTLTRLISIVDVFSFVFLSFLYNRYLAGQLSNYTNPAEIASVDGAAAFIYFYARQLFFLYVKTPSLPFLFIPDLFFFVL